MRALVIEHDHADPAGLIGARLADHRYDVTVFRVVPPDRYHDPGVTVTFPDPAGYDVIAAMGAPWSVTDPRIASWLGPELGLLRGAHGRGIPVLGVCFGGQALAAALGGTVIRAGTPEIGWCWIRTADPELVPAGPWFQCHYDRWTWPAGARRVADSAAGPQAFTLGRSLAVQFHPEASPDVVRLWLENGGYEEFAAAGIDAAAVLAETRGRAGPAAARGRQLVDRFLSRAGRAVPVPA
jgi:GMP synthase-like glutamine amidotransferase